jgi:hypothetical protein
MPGSGPIDNFGGGVLSGEVDDLSSGSEDESDAFQAALNNSFDPTGRSTNVGLQHDRYGQTAGQTAPALRQGPSSHDPGHASRTAESSFNNPSSSRSYTSRESGEPGRYPPPGGGHDWVAQQQSMPNSRARAFGPSSGSVAHPTGRSGAAHSGLPRDVSPQSAAYFRGQLTVDVACQGIVSPRNVEQLVAETNQKRLGRIDDPPADKEDYRVADLRPIAQKTLEGLMPAEVARLRARVAAASATNKAPESDPTASFAGVDSYTFGHDPNLAPRGGSGPQGRNTGKRRADDLTETEPNPPRLRHGARSDPSEDEIRALQHAAELSTADRRRQDILESTYTPGAGSSSAAGSSVQNFIPEPIAESDLAPGNDIPLSRQESVDQAVETVAREAIDNHRKKTLSTVLEKFRSKVMELNSRRGRSEIDQSKALRYYEKASPHVTAKNGRAWKDEMQRASEKGYWRRAALMTAQKRGFRASKDYLEFRDTERRSEISEPPANAVEGRGTTARLSEAGQHWVDTQLRADTGTGDIVAILRGTSSTNLLQLIRDRKEALKLPRLKYGHAV